MSLRRKHAYEVAARMARVKELRVQVALAETVRREEEARKKVTTIEVAYKEALNATGDCLAAKRLLDLARYELLAQLNAALCDKLQAAADTLAQVEDDRSAKASENVLAKRYRENMEERLDDIRHALVHARDATLLEEGVELWLQSRGERS